MSLAASPVVVITGSTKGIGFGLADAFLALGARVVVCGRGRDGVDAAVGRLDAKHGGGRSLGATCEVTRHDDLAALWDAAVARFGRVDVWINNAGTINPQRPFVELDPTVIGAVVTTNMLGLCYGSRVALAGMLAAGHGQLFNMEGWGSRGEHGPGMALYSATKRALAHFTDALVRETRKTPVLVGTLSPGIVVTDLFLEAYRAGAPENWTRSRWLYNLVADDADTVCPWLAERVLANRKSGARFAWMTTAKVVYRFLNPAYHRRKMLPERLH